ncbi:MAG: hypothetical protein V1926_02760 [Candidatus Peregrinibacteria bacterium]
MRQITRWLLILGSVCVGIALLMEAPQLLHIVHPGWKGILVQLNSDEDAYLPRVQEALSGRPEQAAEAIIGDPNAVGLQGAAIERLFGSLFSFTGWRAATVLQIMDGIVPPLLFLSLFVFFVLAGFSKRQSLLGALLFVFLNLYGLNRPIYQAASFLPVVVALVGIIMGCRGRLFLGILGGVILGALVGVYFWSWTFAWAWTGVLFLWLAGEWLFGRSMESRRMMLRLLLFVAVAAMAALPSLLDILRAAQDPLYPLGVFRSGMHAGHRPESLPYAVLFLFMAGGVLLAIAEKPRLFLRSRIVAVTILTSFLVSNQQVFHGVIFNFVSHYLFALACSAVMVLLFSIPLRSKWLLLSLLGSVVYLTTFAYDFLPSLVGQWSVGDEDFSEQHLATALPVFDVLPRATVLSDPATQYLVAGSTHHDIVYSIYLKNVLVTHDELAWRLCMTLLPIPAELRDLARLTIYPDAVGAFPDPAVRRSETALITEACRQVDRDPGYWLRRFGVSYVLWDEKGQPVWDLSRLRVGLAAVGRGEGWSLWRVTPASPPG